MASPFSSPGAHGLCRKPQTSHQYVLGLVTDSRVLVRHMWWRAKSLAFGVNKVVRPLPYVPDESLTYKS